MITRVRGIRRYLLFLPWALAACGGEDGPPVEVVIPRGATLSSVTDSLAVHDVIGRPLLFKAYVRLRRAETRLKAGRYALRVDQRWSDVLDALATGHVVTVPLTIPEGFRLAQMASRIAEVTGSDSTEVMEALTAPDAAARYGVPGPGLEGYLFPDTYRFAQGVTVEEVVRAMVTRNRAVWTPERRHWLDSLEMDEREATTLASIVQAEARHVEEMPRIASVYHNRLERGWLLQADPTVLYALGGPRARLLYAAIDSVADNPYNSYTQPGLPPGPIGAPGEAAIDAVLHPAEEDFLYFVARADGHHVFTRTLVDHNRAKADARRERERGGVRGSGE
jgi:peptidoglycan lytic transglycosylase G